MDVLYDRNLEKSRADLKKLWHLLKSLMINNERIKDFETGKNEGSVKLDRLQWTFYIRCDKLSGNILEVIKKERRACFADRCVRCAV